MNQKLLSALSFAAVLGLMSGSGAFAADAKAKKTKSAKEAVVKIGTKGDELKFDKTEFPANPGQDVTIIFTNNAKSSGMPHNLVVVKPGTADEVATAGMSAGDAKGWIPDSPNIIAHTPLIKPTDKPAEIHFKAPEQAGDYPFICTFPGHAATMRGMMKVGTAKKK